MNMTLHIYVCENIHVHMYVHVYVCIQTYVLMTCARVSKRNPLKTSAIIEVDGGVQEEGARERAERGRGGGRGEGVSNHKHTSIPVY